MSKKGSNGKWSRVQGDKQSSRPEITNHEFAAMDAAFKSACDDANVKPTARQASKYRMKTGKAFKTAAAA